MFKCENCGKEFEKHVGLKVHQKAEMRASLLEQFKSTQEQSIPQHEEAEQEKIRQVEPRQEQAKKVEPQLPQQVEPKQETSQLLKSPSLDFQSSTSPFSIEETIVDKIVASPKFMEAIQKAFNPLIQGAMQQVGPQIQKGVRDAISGMIQDAQASGNPNSGNGQAIQSAPVDAVAPQAGGGGLMGLAIEAMLKRIAGGGGGGGGFENLDQLLSVADKLARLKMDPFTQGMSVAGNLFTLAVRGGASTEGAAASLSAVKGIMDSAFAPPAGDKK